MQSVFPALAARLTSNFATASTRRTYSELMLSVLTSQGQPEQNVSAMNAMNQSGNASTLVIKWAIAPSNFMMTTLGYDIWPLLYYLKAY